MKTITTLNSVSSFETSRIQARQMMLDDFTDFYQTHSHPQVAATLGGVVTEDVAYKKFMWNLQQWNQNGFGLWIYELKETGNFMGRGGLRRVTVNQREEIEVGYAFMPEYWGCGYASEMAKASIEVAFEILNLNDIVCFAATENKASIKVMENAGFKYDCNIMHANIPHVLYRLRNVESPTKEL